MIGSDNFNRFAEYRFAKILNRHLRRNDRSGAAKVGIGAGFVVKHADLHDVIGNLRRRCADPTDAKKRDGEKRRVKLFVPSPHWSFPLIVPCARQTSGSFLA